MLILQRQKVAARELLYGEPLIPPVFNHLPELVLAVYDGFVQAAELPNPRFQLRLLAAAARGWCPGVRSLLCCNSVCRLKGLHSSA